MSAATDLAAIDAKIAELLATTQGNYKVGDTSVDAGDFLKTLYDIKEKLEARINKTPFEFWDTIDTSTDEFGVNVSELLTAAPE